MNASFVALAKKEGWSDVDALRIASGRIDVLEDALREKSNYQTTLISTIRTLEEAVKNLEYRDRARLETISELRLELYADYPCVVGPPGTICEPACDLCRHTRQPQEAAS